MTKKFGQSICAVLVLFMSHTSFCQNIPDSTVSGDWKLVSDGDLTDSTLIFYRFQRDESELFGQTNKYSFSITENGFGYTHGSLPQCATEINFWRDRWNYDQDTGTIIHLFINNKIILQSTSYSITRLNDKEMRLELVEEYYNEDYDN